MINFQTEICEIVSKFIPVVKDILKVQANISKNITITKADIETIKKQNVTINDSIQELTRTIISKLSSDSVPKFQTRLRLVEKNKVTKDFINYVLNKSLNIETLEEENIINIINTQREKAHLDKCYLFFFG